MVAILKFKKHSVGFVGVVGLVGVSNNLPYFI